MVNRYVKLAVSVEIGYRQRAETSPSGIDVCGRAKGSVAIAQKDEHTLTSWTRFRQIKLPVSIQICRSERREVRQGDSYRGLKRAVPVALKERNGGYYV